MEKCAENGEGWVATESIGMDRDKVASSVEVDRATELLRRFGMNTPKLLARAMRISEVRAAGLIAGMNQESTTNGRTGWKKNTSPR